MADEETKTNITKLTHPDYDSSITAWTKYRLTFNGGRPFVSKYLEKFSQREDVTDFASRKKITYCPAHAKASIIEIKNAIFQRMADITRENGPTSYQQAITGQLCGVDLKNNTMTSFIGRRILPSMLSMRRVGVFVDKQPQIDDATKADTVGNRPYLYVYEAEDIRNWAFDEGERLVSLLLRDSKEEKDEETGLVTGYTEAYRLMRVVDQHVEVIFYDKDGVETGTATIEIPEIPFAVFEISQSLLTDVADYQVALLNLESADLNYALKANFPFYTEQYDMRADAHGLMKSASELEGGDEGEATEANTAKPKEVTVGTTKGRRYPKDLDRPAFIHPSSEPLEISMEKEERIKKDIRRLVNLAVAELEPKRASMESKQFDQHTLEAGLSYIGLELAYGENEIGRFWAMYEGGSEPTIIYPTNYSLKSDKERRTEAEESLALMTVVPSPTYQKAMAKEIARIMVGTVVSREDYAKVLAEIDASQVVNTDPEIIRLDHEAGFIGTELASEVRGYPKGEVEKAKTDHAERAARIAAAQSKVGDGARGVDDQDPDPANSGEEEKKIANTPDLKDKGDPK
jgi:hypothetical protein